MTPRYVDVRACLQRRVEEFGGGVLELVAAKVDANQLFGNPLPGKKKELRVRYLVVVSGAYGCCTSLAEVVLCVSLWSYRFLQSVVAAEDVKLCG